MKMAAEGHLTTEALMWNQNVDEKTISGMSSGDFRYVDKFYAFWVHVSICVRLLLPGDGIAERELNAMIIMKNVKFYLSFFGEVHVILYSDFDC